jgi:hypothetical protein
MKFKAGDKIAVLDAVIRGVVIKVEKQYVFIEDEDGFEIKFEPKQLVKIEKDQHELSKFSDINNPLFRAKLVPEKRKSSIQKKNKREGTIPAMEVDLHIQNLVKNTKGMDNFDMLTLQVDTAKHKLEFAIRKRIPRIVFIHGVGEGVLQKELHYLFGRYPVKITEGSYLKYGKGATEVYILQNQ